MKKNSLCIFLLLSFNFSVQAAGFDCTLNTLNDTEKTICQTPYLSGMDNVVNDLFRNAVNNTLSKGKILSDQSNWIKDRDSCKASYECIREKYLYRNSELSSIEAFQPLKWVFHKSLIDAPFEHEIKNKNGFVIRDKPWVIKKLFNENQMERNLNISQGDWMLLTHFEIKNNLALIFSVKTAHITYLISISDIPEQSYIIDTYDGGSSIAPDITLMERNDAMFSFKVTQFTDAIIPAEIYPSAYYEVSFADGVITLPEKIKREPEYRKKEQWTGYCGNSSCDSELLSPDGLWRIASGDDGIHYRNDGVYYFPSNRPDQGVNVFISSAEDKRDDWSFSRSYVWGDKNSFFFDNDGGLACIWKTDIRQKTTERILPVEGLQKPYYIRYNNEDYIISRYIPTDTDTDTDTYDFYIAKSGD